MLINYNGNLISSKDFKVDFKNRSFQYGDGLFETIIVKNNTIQLLNYHFERLIEGLSVLQINHQFSFNSISKQIEELLKVNQLSNARIKLQIWRSEGGLFTPTNNNVEYLITCSPYETSNNTIQKCSFSEKAIVTYNIVSKFKTSSALPYIIAGVEKQDRKLDELIILCNKGFVTECISSNIFWYRNEEYFTPSLETGCVSGVMRRHTITVARNNDIKINIGEFTKGDILTSEGIFTTNAAGCHPIRSIDNNQFNTEIPLIPLLEL